MTVPMGWQLVPVIEKRPGHYTANNADKWCMSEGRRESRNRLICTDCGHKWVANLVRQRQLEGRA